jgi:acetyl esterase/lipase
MGSQPADGMADALIPWLFLVASLIGAWFTWNAFRPAYAPAGRAVVSFFAGWLTTELALHHLAWQAAMTVVFVRAGALGSWPGVVALAITLASWAGLIRLWRAARTAEAAVEQALLAGLGGDYRARILPGVAERLAPGVDWRQIVLPFPIRHPEVECVRGIVYARHGRKSLALDVYRHRDRPAGAPTILYVHGGAWSIGSRRNQGLPLMIHLAARGWVGVNVDYRLSPRATFPDHLVDLKRALVWVRAHAAEYGADPEFVVVTGGSAGGHLAALLALTANDPEYQPGFESADTSVAACVALYGIYDFADRYQLQRNPGRARLLERRVMKAALAEAREAYDKASPITRLHPAAPPFFVIHGDRDTLAPVAEARRFVEEFRRRAHGAIAYAEIPGAQHAFEIFPSLRSTFVIHGIERFLAWVYSRHLVARGKAGARRAG